MVIIEVAKKLFLGTWEDEYNLNENNPNRISHIVLAGSELTPSHVHSFVYYKVGILDISQYESDKRIFDRSNEFISKAHDKEKCVLVISFKYYTLAMMFTIAYLIKRFKMTYEIAIRRLISKRLNISCLKKHNVKMLKNFEYYTLQMLKDPKNIIENYNFMENLVSPYQTSKKFHKKDSSDNTKKGHHDDFNLSKENDANFRTTMKSSDLVKLKTSDNFARSAYNVIMPISMTERTFYETNKSKKYDDNIEHKDTEQKIETAGGNQIGDNFADASLIAQNRSSEYDSMAKTYAARSFYAERKSRELGSMKKQALNYLNNPSKKISITSRSSGRLRQLSYTKNNQHTCEYMYNYNEQLEKPPDLNLAQRGKEFWSEFKGTKYGRRIMDVFYDGDTTGIDKINNFNKNRRKDDKPYTSYLSKKIKAFNGKKMRSESTPKLRSDSRILDLNSDELKNYLVYNPIKSLATSRARTQSPSKKLKVNFANQDENLVGSQQTPNVLAKFAKNRLIWKNHNLPPFESYNQHLEKDFIPNWNNFCLKILSNSVYLFCKSCGYKIISQEFVIPHIKKESDKSMVCKGVFVKKKDWLLKYNISCGSIIGCPGCSKIIGYADGRGLSCNCGHKEIPAYLIQKKEINVKM